MSTFSYTSRDFPDTKAKNTHREYLSCEEFMKQITKHPVDEKREVYTTRNGRRQAPQVRALMHHPVPEDLGKLITEPNVTSQILNLESTTYTILEGLSALETTSSTKEQLACVVSGVQTWHLVTGWQRLHLY